MAKAVPSPANLALDPRPGTLWVALDSSRQYGPGCRVDGDSVGEFGEGADYVEQAGGIERAAFPVIVLAVYLCLVNAFEQHDIEPGIGFEYAFELLWPKFVLELFGQFGALLDYGVAALI